MSIRHDCETGGCYIKKLTPDWGFLDDAFSGKIRVTDIDGAVEKNGHLLILEWKSECAALTVGQQIMFERITEKSRITVFVIYGDAELSTPKRVTVFSKGIEEAPQECDKEKLIRWCRAWECKAKSNEIENI